MVSNVSNSNYTSSTTAASTPAKTTAAATAASASDTSAVKDDAAAVYEKSDAAASKTSVVAKKDNSAVVAKLKADQEARLSSLQSLVEKLISKQGNTYAKANASTDIMNDSSFWNAIRTGQFEVDEETAAQAKEDISEDGYWGVKQTSDRLLDFAKALTGGDPSKVEEMRNAIQKGFKEAAKLWGGDLPDISQQTYDATMEKLDAWAKEATA